jgi:hypothetical protein
MATTILTDIPDQITAGDSIAWKKSFSSYSAADAWVLSYALAKTGNHIIFTGSALGADHLIEVAAATTADWEPGEYGFDAYVTKSAERYQVDSGLVLIRPDLAEQTTGFAALPYCFTVRDAIIAVFEMRATESQSSIAVGGRQISEMSHLEIQDALSRATQACNLWKRRNRRDRGRATGTRIKVAFTND